MKYLIAFFILLWFASCQPSRRLDGCTRPTFGKVNQTVQKTQ